MTWWEILLMTTGGIIITIGMAFVVIMLLCLYYDSCHFLTVIAL